MRKVMEGVKRYPREAKAGFLVLLMILSVFLASPILTNPETHMESMRIIDGNKDEALGLAATVTIASTALSFMPDDVAAPLADELSELSTPLLVIVCILYFEQFMLTSMEYLSFSILIPIALGLRVTCLYYRRKSWLLLSSKLLLIAVLCACMIPVSTAITGMIEDAFAESLNIVQDKLDNISEAFSKIIGGESNGDVLAFIGNVATGIGSIFEFAEESLGLMIDGVAILIITSCVIPLITILLFVWGVKSVITGRIENLEDTAVDLWKRIPNKKKKELEEKKENLSLTA